MALSIPNYRPDWLLRPNLTRLLSGICPDCGCVYRNVTIDDASPLRDVILCFVHWETDDSPHTWNLGSWINEEVYRAIPLLREHIEQLIFDAIDPMTYFLREVLNA